MLLDKKKTIDWLNLIFKGFSISKLITCEVKKKLSHVILTNSIVTSSIYRIYHITLFYIFVSQDVYTSLSFIFIYLS